MKNFRSGERERILHCLVLVLVGIITAIPAAAKDSNPADLVLLHGEIYTVDSSRSWAQALAVRQGRIVFVGTDAEAKKWIGPATQQVDLHGRMVLPGFHDSHVHLAGGGIELEECNLNGLTTQDEVVSAIRKYAETHPNKKWIRGGGWPLTLYGGNPTKDLLDSIVPDRPVLLDAFDGHSTWANSKALTIAGITRETPDPPRGRIERDEKTGEPSGTLRESASQLVVKKAPAYSHDDFVAGLRRGMKIANSFGITSVHEARVVDEHLNAFAELDRKGELTVRAVGSMHYDPGRGLTQVPRFVEWRKKYNGKRFRATAVKIFQDGVIESRTAALLQPYLGGKEEERGLLNVELEDLKPLAAELDRLGLQIHVHAIGDRAVQTTLDALEFARMQNGVRDSRHHIAHLQLVDPLEIRRFRKLGVIANFQPLWAFADTYIEEMTLPLLGPERSRWLYPLRSVANTGAVLVSGSDWPVTSMNPLEAIQVGVTRRDPALPGGEAFIPEERVDLPQMIASYTIHGAYLSFQEKETGSLEAGKLADFIILNCNLFDVPAAEIHKVKVQATYLEGTPVFQDEGWNIRAE